MKDKSAANETHDERSLTHKALQTSYAIIYSQEIND